MIAVVAVLASLTMHQSPEISHLDQLAQARDVQGISAVVTGLPTPNPLDVVRTNGAYECGKFGWHADEMDSPDGKGHFVVLSTPLTSEDIGDFLFKREGTSLRYIPEDQAMGMHIVGHRLEVAFDISAKRARISDDFSVTSTGTGDFTFRMSKEFKVSSITDSAGAKVPFAQGGGIVILPKPKSGPATYKLVYDGIVDYPLYSGSITTSEATLANSYWYPFIARQPAPYEVTVHYPENWIAVGQGIKVGEKPGVSHFKMDLPCVFYSLSVGPYKTASYKDGDRTFYAWSPRDSQAVLETQAETYDSIIKFYSRFAPFPFKSYGGLDSPQYGGGALEAYSYATYGGGFPHVDPHEPSHTWWGGILDNTYLHSFWNESFAVFSEGLYRREWSNNDAVRHAFIPRGEVNQGYDRYACAASGADLGPIASDLGYGKGSHVLLMLEKLIGTDAMVRSMRRFVSNQPPEVPTEWGDFEKAAEQENPDKNLAQFFADWLHRPGHLEMNASAIYEGGAVKISYQPAGEPYRIPLEVLIGYPDGKTETHFLDVREAKEIAIPTSSKPAYVSIDPYRFLIRHVQADEQPEGFSGVRGELQAYVDPAHPAWARGVSSVLDALPADLSGTFIIGSPETLPAMAELCRKVGFEISQNKLTYKGVTVDLDHGGGEAIVDLGGAKRCGIRLGTTRINPDIGTAKVGVYDDLGRMLTGNTLPKTQGTLTFHF